MSCLSDYSNIRLMPITLRLNELRRLVLKQTYTRFLVVERVCWK